MKVGGIMRDEGGGSGCAGQGRAGQGKEKGDAMQTHRGVMVWQERIEGEEGGLREEAMGQRGGGGCPRMKTNEEIGVFNAERYFERAGAEQQAGWAREEEEELMDGEAGGDLPLSPLVEFGGKGKWRSSCEAVQVVEARGWAAPFPGRRRVESSEFTSPRTSTASSLSEVEPPLQQRTGQQPLAAAAGKAPKSKLQPASPSSRLASFLAKFKPPTPRKHPATAAPIPHLTSSAATPPPPPSVLSPAKKLVPNSLLLPSRQGKTPSPRGRFLRAFSSSSVDHASGSSLRHHSSLKATPPSMAASSPVSPAARSAPPDPYSPITNSFSTTPTSTRIPLTSPHSMSLPAQSYNSNPSSYGKPHSAAFSRRNFSHGSFKQQLPLLSRKLKVYLMPDKAGADHSGKKEDVARIPGELPNGGAAATGDVLRLRKHTAEQKQRRRWLHAEDQVVDEDIELAERLLRVVQDHQSSHAGRSKPTAHHTIHSHQRKSSNNIHGYGYAADRVSEYSRRKYDQMHPTAHTTSNLMISAHANMSPGRGVVKSGQHHSTSINTRHVAKEESSLYDSDSSSDLFEIETLASVGMGLYRRDLPVYETKEPSYSNHSFTFASR